jgi:hypothetical protein
VFTLTSDKLLISYCGQFYEKKKKMGPGSPAHTQCIALQEGESVYIIIYLGFDPKAALEDLGYLSN